MGASEIINRLFAEMVGMSFPPSRATIVRAEFSCFSALLLCQFNAALFAKEVAHRLFGFGDMKIVAEVISAAVGFYCVDGYAECIGYFGIAFALMTKLCDTLFL